jgi:hypothetical protein
MTEETSGERAATPTISEELDRLGRQLGEAFKAAWQSEERQELQRELKEGFSALGAQLEDGVQSARKSEALAVLKADLKSAAVEARQAVPLEDIRGGLVKGLQKLNSELTELIERWQAKPIGDATVTEKSEHPTA